MLEINESLKLLKDENQRVLEEMRSKHQVELQALETAKTEEINLLTESHSIEMTEIIQTNKRDTDSLKQEISQLAA